MTRMVLLVDYHGTYGGPSSRDEVLRVLKEAIALVEATARTATIVCGGLRIECLDRDASPKAADERHHSTPGAPGGTKRGT